MTIDEDEVRIIYSALADGLDYDFYIEYTNDDNACCSNHEKYIYITTGCINSLHNTTELIYILLHELGHAYYNHGISIIRQCWSRKQLELEADSYAIRRMHQMGLDVDHARAYCQRAWDLYGDVLNPNVQPSMEEIDAIISLETSDANKNRDTSYIGITANCAYD